MNMELDLGVDLFDRSSRSPVLTERGKVLLKYAGATLRSHRQLAAIANAMSERQESHLGFALEQGTYTPAIAQVLVDLQLPGHCLLVMTRLRQRADHGIMIETVSF